MTTSKTNALSYIQAAISLLLILYSFFYRTIIYNHFSIQHIAYYYNLVDFYSILMINIINIFIQAHGSCKTFSVISAILVLLGIMRGLYSFELYNLMEDRLPIVIYPLLLLLMVQLILPVILLIVENSKKRDRIDIAA